MGQRLRLNCAAAKDAHIVQGKEECALSMGQRSSYAAKEDAQTLPSKEECASGMGQRSNCAAEKSVQIVPSKEECASNMEHHGLRSNAAVKDAQNKLCKEECV